jgi:hypothetical protein
VSDSDDSVKFNVTCYPNQIARIRYTVQMPSGVSTFSWRMPSTADEDAARRALANITEEGHEGWIVRTLEDQHGGVIRTERLP